MSEIVRKDGVSHVFCKGCEMLVPIIFCIKCGWAGCVQVFQDTKKGYRCPACQFKHFFHLEYSGVPDLPIYSHFQGTFNKIG